MIPHYIHDWKLAQAKELAKKLNDQTTLACLDNPSSANSTALARAEAGKVFADPDPEVR
jgi:hypothetical protein